MYDVIVVGAGLSGLQTARSVRAAGLSVCVLEATNRVGGKTFTAKSCENGFNDLGAAWINDTSQSEMFKLFQRYGIDTEVQRACGDTIIESVDGSVEKVPYGQFSGNPDILQGLLEEFRNHSSLVNLQNPVGPVGAEEIDKLTFREFCVQISQDGNTAVTVADVISGALLGVESDEVSALYMLHYFKCGSGIDNLLSDQKDGGQYLRNRQGNQAISKKMAEELGSNVIRLHAAVTSIDQTPGRHCVVQTATGERFHCRRVVVSVPTTLYHTINFSPPLPKNKTVLSENTVMGYYSKMIYVFSEPWWQKAGFSGILDSGKGPISFTRDTSIAADCQWSITCFIVGEKGRQWSKLSKAARHKQAWEQFSQVFGKFVDSIPLPTNSLEIEWTKQAFFLGAPCPVMTPGVLTSVGVELATPVGCVHFAGTETSSVWRGYMEGAVRSGQRAGAEVVKALSREVTAQL